MSKSSNTQCNLTTISTLIVLLNSLANGVAFVQRRSAGGAVRYDVYIRISWYATDRLYTVITQYTGQTDRLTSPGDLRSSILPRRFVPAQTRPLSRLGRWTPPLHFPIPSTPSASRPLCLTVPHHFSKPSAAPVSGWWVWKETWVPAINF